MLYKLLPILKSIIVIIILSIILVGCSSKPKIPVWKISKANTPTSYLVGTNDYLSKKDIDIMLTNNIIHWFDSCEAYIPFWDLKNASITETKKWIEIGNNKSLKDTLSNFAFNLLKNKVMQYNLESGLNYELPDSIKIKPHFYLNDIITFNNNKNFNLYQFFFKRALPHQKDIIGLETFQSFYEAFSSANFEYSVSKLNEIKSLHKVKKLHQKKSRELYLSGNYKTYYNYELEAMANEFVNYNELLIQNNTLWINKIENVITKQKAFIALDINLVSKENPNSLYHKLLSKGYNLERIN
jgi:uncharacterized protein YbaP (TraB family)